MSDETQQQLPEPSIELSDAGPARKKLQIEIPPERINAKLEDSFKNLQGEAQIPGFRKGRAPRRLLEKRFGSDVRREVFNQVVGEAYSEAVEQNELRVLGEPDIKDFENLALPDDGPLNFEAEVEVAPEVELPELEGIKVYKPTFEPSDDQVEAEINRYCQMYGRMTDLEEGDESQPEDYLTADVEIRSADGEVLEERNDANVYLPGETPNNYKGVVTGVVVEDLGKTLAGKKIGDTEEISTKGPQRHENEQLVERDLVLAITIKQIRRVQALSVDELVEMVGMENADELRDQVKQSLEDRAQSQQHEAMTEQVTEHLMDKIDIEVPEKMSSQQAQQIMQRQAMQMMQQGMSQEQLGEQIEMLQASSEEEARRHLKQMFILDAVARDRDVDVTEEEVNSQVAQLAAQQGKRPEQQRQEMQESGQLEQLAMRLREQKAVDQVIEKAEVEEISAEDWQKMQEAKAGEGEGDAGAEASSGGSKNTSKKTKKKSKSSKKAKTEKASESGGDEGEAGGSDAE